MIRLRKQAPAGRTTTAGRTVAKAGLWVVSAFAVTSALGALAVSAGPIAAQSTPSNAVNRMGGTAESVATAPSAARVSTIGFSLSRTGTGPNDQRTQFDFGPQVVYGFVDYSEVNVGDRLRWVLRFREGPTDVNFGDIVATGTTGRAVLELKRLDNQPLMPGSFDLVLGILPEAGGLELLRRSFEIVGDGESSSSRSSGDNSSGDNCSSDSSGDNSSEDNGSGNDCSSNRSGDNSSEDNSSSDSSGDNSSEDNSSSNRSGDNSSEDNSSSNRSRDNSSEDNSSEDNGN